MSATRLGRRFRSELLGDDEVASVQAGRLAMRMRVSLYSEAFEGT
jgi:hypothetical protein